MRQVEKSAGPFEAFGSDGNKYAGVAYHRSPETSSRGEPNPTTPGFRFELNGGQTAIRTGPGKLRIEGTTIELTTDSPFAA